MGTQLLFSPNFVFIENYKATVSLAWQYWILNCGTLSKLKNNEMFERKNVFRSKKYAPSWRFHTSVFNIIPSECCSCWLNFQLFFLCLLCLDSTETSLCSRCRCRRCRGRGGWCHHGWPHCRFLQQVRNINAESPHPLMPQNICSYNSYCFSLRRNSKDALQAWPKSETTALRKDKHDFINP